MMRRQVKPFLTEYRSSPRRTKDTPDTSELHPDAQRQRPPSEAQRVFGSDAPEDSYEAALRAADALFSRADKSVAVPQDDPIETSSRAADTSSQDPVAARQEVRDVFADPPSPGADMPPELATTTAAPRRILQAIEPPEEDRFAALEAERAPKRRGRKPGSKNKPKIGVGDDWAGASRPGAAKSAIARLSGEADRPIRVAASVLPAVFEAGEPSNFGSDQAEAADLADLGSEVADGGDEAAADSLSTLRPRGDRLGWKRAGLRPGERWKRRLPKVAW